METEFRERNKTRTGKQRGRIIYKNIKNRGEVKKKDDLRWLMGWGEHKERVQKISVK